MRGAVIDTHDVQAVVIRTRPRRDADTAAVRIHDVLHESLQVDVFPGDEDGRTGLGRRNQPGLKARNVVLPVPGPDIPANAHGSRLDRRQRTVVVRQA